MPRAQAPCGPASKIQRLQPDQEVFMADHFQDHDNDTPTEADLDQAYGSKFLSAADRGDRNIRTRIMKVKQAALRGSDGTVRVRFLLYLEGIGKPMVLNETNKVEIVKQLGRDPAKWKGAFVELYVDPNVTFAGKRVGGLRLRVLGPSTAAKPTMPVMPPEPPPHDGSGIEDMSDSIPI
jgi:hypothetical protein